MSSYEEEAILVQTLKMHSCLHCIKLLGSPSFLFRYYGGIPHVFDPT